jgi:putative heme-binding domain-containing protein
MNTSSLGFSLSPALALVLAPLLLGPSPGVRPVQAADTSGLAAAATPVEQLKVAKGFRVELLYTVPKEQQGSWVAMTVDPRGRLIVSDQYGKLYRLKLPPLNAVAAPEIETIDLAIGQAQGLLYAFDSLYVMVANQGYEGRGLYRLRDTDGDDRFDQVRLLRKLDGGGEHGPHAIVLSPDTKSLYIIVGNQTKLTQIERSRVPQVWGEDHLLPRLWDGNGFMKGVLAPGGWIARTDPEGKSWELIATGFRNEYDAAFNRHGDLFTFDADMEWDLNTPWYRPTRVCLAASGAEFGWRSGAGKWPAYYPDSLPAVVDIGPGSPTGVVFGYGAKFPARYQEALFICDWSYGKLYAVHLTPDGSAYRGQAEEFIAGQPFPLTDLVINPHDGAMYVAIGGRRTQSALYRVTYTGAESTAPSRGDSRHAQLRTLRRELEAFHGHKDPAAVGKAWPVLGHKDRYLRFAARVALEWQDPATWQDKALREHQVDRSLGSLIALCRVGAASLQPQILAALDRIQWKQLDPRQRLDLLRAYSLVFTRMGQPAPATRERLSAKFDALFPAPEGPQVNAELGQMLVYLEAPSAATKLMRMLAQAPTQEEQIEYARSLRVLRGGWTMSQRQEYFAWYQKAASFKGGASLRGFLRDMKADAEATLSASEREELKPLMEAKPALRRPEEILAARPFVKEWTVEELAARVDRSLRGRDFERGRRLYGEVACAACHRYASEGGAIGPDLTGVAGRFNRRDLLESIIQPSKEISDQYGAILVKKKNGDTVSGRVANLDGDRVMIIENLFAPGDMTSVQRKDIESIAPSTVSMMPEGLVSTLREDEIYDLMAFLLSGGDSKHRMFRP